MSKRHSVKAEHRASFLPPLNPSLRDDRTPSLVNIAPVHMQLDSRVKLLKKWKRRDFSVGHFLSSRVDFINDENNRRMKIHEKRKVDNIKPTVFKKQAVYIPSELRKNSARLVRLIQKVYLPQLHRTQQAYIPLTSRIVNVSQLQEQQA